LEKLNLSFCNIDKIPASVKNLTNLKILSINDNKLYSIDSSIGKLKNLEILNLEYCRLDNIPLEVKNLSNLRSIKVNNNKFKKFPNILCEICSLKEIYFYDIMSDLEDIEFDNNEARYNMELLIRKRLLYRLFFILKKSILRKIKNYKIIKNLINY
jgi:Leucine-rich repeat (LRR) protein